jgi:hypothetical protein
VISGTDQAGRDDRAGDERYAAHYALFPRIRINGSAASIPFCSGTPCELLARRATVSVFCRVSEPSGSAVVAYKAAINVRYNASRPSIAAVTAPLAFLVGRRAIASAGAVVGWAVAVDGCNSRAVRRSKWRPTCDSEKQITKYPNAAATRTSAEPRRAFASRIAIPWPSNSTNPMIEASDDSLIVLT